MTNPLQIIPTIGVTGTFSLTVELDSFYNKNVPYTCKSIRTLADIVNSGQDPFEEFYEPLGLPLTQFESDMTVGACIVGLSTTDDRWIYIPSTQIIAIPDQSGIRYTPLALGVTLGAVNDDYDLTGLKNKIAQAVMGYLNHEAQIETLVIGETEMISKEQHDNIMTVRIASAREFSKQTPGMGDIMSENEQLKARVANYEAYILRIMPDLKAAMDAGHLPPGII